ncbi:MAG: hypothetical protein V4642_04755 [Bacteroidota bacterium]
MVKCFWAMCFFKQFAFGHYGKIPDGAGMTVSRNGILKTFLKIVRVT